MLRNGSNFCLGTWSGTPPHIFFIFTVRYRSGNWGTVTLSVVNTVRWYGTYIKIDPSSQDYPPNSYVVAVYQGQWYVGQTIAKEGEPEAEEGDQYVLVSFMERSTGDLLKWPKRSDILNVLKEDILFSCQPPVPCASTSSSRSLTYSLSKADAKKAKILFMTKAYYLTKTYFRILQCVTRGCVCVYQCEVERVRECVKRVCATEFLSVWVHCLLS
jgi:hypothetical protein